MTIQAVFGARSARASTTAQSQEKAQYWLNFGYLENDEDGARFISLPVGIPLDTTKPLSTDRGDVPFRMFQKARNDLLQELIAQAGNLEPGQDVVFPLAGETDLAVQIRRVEVKEELPATETTSRRLIAIAKAA